MVKRSRLSALFNSVAEPEESNTMNVRCEYQKYKSLLDVSTYTFDDNPLSLVFWQQHCHVLPHLSLVARRYLGMQATSCASERLFSQAGLIVTKFRSCLSTDLVGQLVFLATNDGDDLEL